MIVSKRRKREQRDIAIESHERWLEVYEQTLAKGADEVAAVEAADLALAPIGAPIGAPTTARKPRSVSTRSRCRVCGAGERSIYHGQESLCYPCHSSLSHYSRQRSMEAVSAGSEAKTSREAVLPQTAPRTRLSPLAERAFA